MRSTGLAIVLIRSRMCRLVQILVTFNEIKRQKIAKWPLFCVILPNLVVSGAHCLKVVDKAITTGNLRLLSTSKRLHRDRATPTV